MGMFDRFIKTEYRALENPSSNHMFQSRYTPMYTPCAALTSLALKNKKAVCKSTRQEEEEEEQVHSLSKKIRDSYKTRETLARWGGI